MELDSPRPTYTSPARMGTASCPGGLIHTSYEPLLEAFLKHLTYKAVFLLAMASAERHSELQAVVFNPNYWQFKPQGSGVTLYFSPEFM